MPGMMDTVLNLGITETAIERLAAWSDDRHFASDAARRFVQTFGKVVLGVDEMSFSADTQRASRTAWSTERCCSHRR